MYPITTIGGLGDLAPSSGSIADKTKLFLASAASQKNGLIAGLVVGALIGAFFLGKRR